MSHCVISGRMPAMSIQPGSRANRYIISTTVILDEERSFKAELHAYLETPPQERSLFQLVASFANNGGDDIMMGSDHRDMEVLGTASPSDPDYLATCPDILAPKIHAIGTVANIVDNMPIPYYSFTVGGSTFIESLQPFTIRVRVEKENPRWKNFIMPILGSSVFVEGFVIDREQPDTGLFIIDLNRITYIGGSGRRSTSTKSPVKTPQGKGNDGNWMQSQQNAKNKNKNKRKRGNDDDGDDDKGEGPSSRPTQS
ncbi:hypothetical protein B0H15DRAFT_801648 [Mycena belliarum]|uniref:Uncharacterized protein n=1 Tax=Mycena belliarum TaxID=1033014 RepID=A0AAD6U5W9_9AGAR|nr:hypothetical protein B0H15DRAFT_801648 [Mycena belliae]